LKMSELEEAWELALAEANRRAQAAGRADIARYLDLRAKNDLLRRTAVDWLTAFLTSLAGEANRKGAGIQIERQDPHRFRQGSATMVGIQITLRSGVRALSIESGWPRTPRDGIVSGNGLACANIKHFGRHRSNAQLLLARSSNGLPRWLVLEKTGAQTPLSEARIRQHFSLLLVE
jgi:hypothetical protein